MVMIARLIYTNLPVEDNFRNTGKIRQYLSAATMKPVFGDRVGGSKGRPMHVDSASIVDTTAYRPLEMKAIIQYLKQIIQVGDQDC